MSESKRPQLSRRHVVASAGAMAIASAIADVLPVAAEPGSPHDDAGSAARKDLRPTATGKPV
jgi:hypothetical protein